MSLRDDFAQYQEETRIMELVCSHFAFEEIRLIHERHVSEMPFEELLGLGPPIDS